VEERVEHLFVVAGPYLRDELVESLGRDPPGIVFIGDRRGVRAERDHRARSFRVGRGEQQREATPDMAAEERRSLGTGRIHHAEDVVQAVLEDLAGRPAIGKTGPRSVERDQTGERSETGQEPCERGEFPLHSEVTRPAQEEDEVEPRVDVADHLIRDQELIIASGVCDGGHVEPHAGSLGGRSSRASLAFTGQRQRSRQASVMNASRSVMLYVEPPNGRHCPSGGTSGRAPAHRVSGVGG